VSDVPTTRRGLCVEQFCGWGGLSLGIEQAGFDVAVGIDVEPVNAAVHEYNFGYGRSIAGDLFEDHVDAIRRSLPANAEIDAMTMGRTADDVLGRPQLDLVTGGPPCQGISSIGRRDPLDPRNRLMDSFIDHGTRLGARYLVMEQVPTLLQPQNAEHLDHLRERLHVASYSMVEPRTLRAIDFGVPQRRERVFLLIHRNDQAPPAYPQATHDDGQDMFLRRTPTVRDAFDGLADADDHEDLWDRDWTFADPIAPEGWYGRVMTGLENDPDDLSYRRTSRRDVMTCSQRTRHDGTSVARFLATAPGGSERISRRHRLDPEGQSLTLRAGSNAEHGSFTAVVPIHPKGTRQVTAREAARLHSIPDWVRLSTTKIWAYRQIGNSVPPLLGRAVGRAIAKAAGLAPAQPSETIELGSESLLGTANAMARNRRAA
jgi:DNA (cytosine-5)-methyltransferase 1